MSNENKSEQLEIQLLFTIKQAGKILNMPESTIRNFVHKGTLKRCEHLGDRPWYFTMEQLLDFINNKNSG
jgi:hypothetical protein